MRPPCALKHTTRQSYCWYCTEVDWSLGTPAEEVPPTIKVIVERDYDNYFATLVARWIRTKILTGRPFKHTEIHINSGPYRADAVTFTSKNGVLKFDFYAALRSGFGSLSEQDVKDIIEVL